MIHAELGTRSEDVGEGQSLLGVVRRFFRPDGGVHQESSQGVGSHYDRFRAADDEEIGIVRGPLSTASSLAKVRTLRRNQGWSRSWTSLATGSVRPIEINVLRPMKW